MLQPLGKQGVLVEQIGIGVDADGRDFELALEGAAVERLDVLQFVLKDQVAGVDLAVGQGVEHEGVVGIGAMSDVDDSAVMTAIVIDSSHPLACLKNSRVTSWRGSANTFGRAALDDFAALIT